MKQFFVSVLITALTLISAHALQQRTFHNTDKTKSFSATLTAYDASTQKVTILNASGKQISFVLSKLSPECQKYVLSKKDILAAARYIDLDFDEVKGKRSGKAIPTHFDIEVYNRGKSSIEEVKLRYTLYYKQGDLNKGGSAARTYTASLRTGMLYDGDTVTLATKKINIVREIKKPQGGG